MTIRLNKVTRDLNVGITTAVEFLQKKGFTVEANPNTKITDEQFEMLKKEFSNDKNLKIKSERFIQERQSSKDRNKGGTRAVASEKEKQEETKAVVPGDKMQKFKVLGKIDLSKPLQSGGYVPVSEPAAQTEADERAAICDSTVVIHIDRCTINEIPLSKLVQSVAYVELETNDSSLLYTPTNIKLTDSLIYVYDIMEQLKRFDRKGHYLGNAYQRGEGPEELINLYDFDVDEDDL